MRTLINSNRIFDTQVDTRKIFVPMNHKFQLRKNINKDGKSLLYLHIFQNSQLKRISLDINIESKYWIHCNQRVSKLMPNHEDTNLILDHIESKITTIKIQFRLSETVMTLEKFVEEFKTGVPRADFLLFFEAALKNEALKKHRNTVKKQRSVLKALTEFRSKILFTDMNLDLIEKFRMHRQKKGMKLTTINSNIAVIKKYLNIAQESGIKLAVNTKLISAGNTNGNRESLNDEEFNKLRFYYESGFLRDNHKVPLALFLFSCFTGIRISDAQSLAPEKIHNNFLKFTAVKTQKFQKILLNKNALFLLEDCPEILTEKYTDQHINRILKDIASLTGVKRNITFHLARHTFATQYLISGGTVEVLQQHLGHSNIKETMIYVTIRQEQQDAQILLMDEIKVKPLIR